MQIRSYKSSDYDQLKALYKDSSLYGGQFDEARDGANPTIGTVGRQEEVLEERIEVTCDGDDVRTIVDVIREAHSYEEPAIDVYELVEL